MRGRALPGICARLEEELQGLDPAEQAEMLASYGIEESGLPHYPHGLCHPGAVQLFYRRAGRSVGLTIHRLEASAGRGRHPHGF